MKIISTLLITSLYVPLFAEIAAEKENEYIRTINEKTMVNAAYTECLIRSDLHSDGTTILIVVDKLDKSSEIINNITIEDKPVKIHIKIVSVGDVVNQSVHKNALLDGRLPADYTEAMNALSLRALSVLVRESTVEEDNRRTYEQIYSQVSGFISDKLFLNNIKSVLSGVLK